MPDFLKQLSLPAGWEVWGVAGAGVAAAFLAFFAGRRFFTVPPRLPVVERPTPPPPPDPFEVGSQSEKRMAIRRKGSSVEVQIQSEGDGPGTTGWVSDRSLGGLGIVAEHEVARGTILKVRPRNAPVAVPWVEVEVRSCKLEYGAWQLGCSFRKTPPYSVLLLFG